MDPIVKDLQANKLQNAQQEQKAAAAGLGLVAEKLNLRRSRMRRARRAMRRRGRRPRMRRMPRDCRIRRRSWASRFSRRSGVETDASF